MPQEEHDTCRHRRLWRQDVKLLLGNCHTPRQDQELSIKIRVLPPPMATAPPGPPAPRYSPESLPVGHVIQGIRPGIQASTLAIAGVHGHRPPKEQRQPSITYVEATGLHNVSYLQKIRMVMDRVRDGCNNLYPCPRCSLMSTSTHTHVHGHMIFAHTLGIHA